MHHLTKDCLHVRLTESKLYQRRLSITSNNDFFKNESLVYKIDDEKLTFRLAGLEDRNTIKPTKVKSKDGYSMVLCKKSLEIKTGDYLIDEDSLSEDEITIYLQ